LFVAGGQPCAGGFICGLCENPVIQNLGGLAVVASLKRVTSFFEHVIDHLATVQRVARLGAPQRKRVVQGTRGHLCGAQRAELRQVEHELRRCFSARGIDELEYHG